MEEVGVSILETDIIADMTVHATYIDGEKVSYIYLVDTWGGMPDNLEPTLHESLEWRKIEDLPYPLIPHIRV